MAVTGTTIGSGNDSVINEKTRLVCKSFVIHRRASIVNLSTKSESILYYVPRPGTTQTLRRSQKFRTRSITQLAEASASGS